MYSNISVSREDCKVEIYRDEDSQFQVTFRVDGCYDKSFMIYLNEVTLNRLYDAVWSALRLEAEEKEGLPV